MAITDCILPEIGRFATILYRIQKAESCDLQRRQPNPASGRSSGLTRRRAHILGVRFQFRVFANENRLLRQWQVNIYIALQPVKIFENAVWPGERMEHGSGRSTHYSVNGYVKVRSREHKQCMCLVKVCRTSPASHTDCTETTIDCWCINDTTEMLFSRTVLPAWVN